MKLLWFYTDQEQRKLYEAAKVIQMAYRHYRDKQHQQHLQQLQQFRDKQHQQQLQQMQQQMQAQKEIEAAILIQSYYRRYKTVLNLHFYLFVCM